MDQVPPPADWYPDPTGRFEFRYHNGLMWTGDVSVDGHRFLDPLRSTGSSPNVGPAGGPPFAGVPFRESSGTGKARAAFVLGLCSFLLGWVPFLCLLAAGAAVVALIFAIGVLRRERQDRRETGTLVVAAQRPGHGYAVAGAIFAPLGLLLSAVGVWLTVVTLREVQTFTTVGRYSLVEESCGVDASLATYTGTITNESSSTKSYEVTVEFLRPGTSVRQHIGTVSIDDVIPGASARVVVNQVVSEPNLDCKVVAVTGPLPFSQS